ncbi:MAG: hypothetical protein Q8K30_00220 [Candidatus Gracilibacteria bacterium]|nr:hypothetical protein [Candidatus Gracilibacteria bacterium]
MKTNTYTKPENFIDFESPDAEEIIDRLLAEAENSPTISFEEFFDETNKFRINLGKNV